jgi:hypothetical protein
MNQSRNRITRLAVLSLMLIGITGLFTLSGSPKSAQAINLFRTKLSNPIADQLMRLVAPNATNFLNAGALPVPGLSAAAQGQASCNCTDIVLVVDDTGSMEPAINNVKAGLASIIATANTASGMDLRMGLVTFKDQIEVDQPFTNSIPTITAAVNAITTGAGPGEFAASDEALKLVVTGTTTGCNPPAMPKGPLGSFRQNCFRIAIIITDNPPGGCGAGGYMDGVDDVNAINVANAAAALTPKIIISSVLVEGTRVPSPAHPLPGGVEGFVMSMYASITGGKFVTVPTNGAGTGAAIEGIIKDATPPSIVCPANLVRTTDPGQCAAKVDFTVPVADNCPGVTVSCTPASGSIFPKGVTPVTCKATDSSGNMSQPCTFTITVNDAEQPKIMCPSPITQPTDPGKCSAVVNFAVTATDNCPGVMFNCNPPSGSVFQKGTTPVNCTASDAVGNMSSCSFPVTVVDLEKPQITCPKDITTTTCDDPVVITYPPPVVSDNCPGVTFACVPPSSSAFPPGVTTVTCTATDTSGNQASCAFKVTVEQVKCHTICFRSPQYYLLNLNSLPGGEVLIGGVNSNVEVSTSNTDAIRLALQGTATGFGTLTPLQQLNQEFVAAQLSLEAVGGDDSPPAIDALWSPLHAYGLNLGPIALSNGFTFTRDSMLKDVFMQARSAIFEDRKADMVLIANLLDLLNGNSPLNVCGPRHPIADLVPIVPDGFSSFCAFFTSSGMQFLRVTIKNQGDATAAASITAVAFGNTTVNVATPSLLPNQTVDLNVAVPTGGGPPVKIKITADVGGTLLERSNSNNVVDVSCP